MIRRNNPNDSSHEQGNILGSKPFLTPKPSVVQSHTLAPASQNNYFTNLDSEMSEVSGAFGRVNPTSNSSTLRLAHAGISHEHDPANPQLVTENFFEPNYRTQTKSVTTVTQNYNTVPKSVMGHGLTQVPPNFVSGS